MSDEAEKAWRDWIQSITAPGTEGEGRPWWKIVNQETAFMAGRASVHDNFSSLRSRIGALEAAISGALELADAHDWAEEDWLQIGRIRVVLTLAPSVVLDGMIREARAEAWDEGRESVGLDMTKPLGSDGQRRATPNPHRNGDA